jgi:hypothetical protein
MAVMAIDLGVLSCAKGVLAMAGRSQKPLNTILIML